MPVKSLRSRLDDGEFVVCAEGYLFEFERRGYLQAGAYVPEVVLENPHLVKMMYEEFVHAGSDVVEAFTYYAHREKLRTIGRETDLERINRTALKLARQVADETGTLMAGNICNSCLSDPGDRSKDAEKREMYKEQILWAVEEGADYIIAETIGDYDEANLALSCIKEYAPGKEAVIMLVPCEVNDRKTTDGVNFAEACRRLEKNGADVVGLNCGCSPMVYMDLLGDIRESYKGQMAGLPVPYRTDREKPRMTNLIVEKTQKRAFPYNLDAFLCPVDDIVDYTKYCMENKIQYIGICCGNSSRFTRAMVETLGRKPAASRYSPNMSLHWCFGTDKTKLNLHESGPAMDLKKSYGWKEEV